MQSIRSRWSSHSLRMRQISYGVIRHRVEPAASLGMVHYAPRAPLRSECRDVPTWEECQPRRCYFVLVFSDIQLRSPQSHRTI